MSHGPDVIPKLSEPSGGQKTHNDEMPKLASAAPPIAMAP